jgi:hypothetical protein
MSQSFAGTRARAYLAVLGWLGDGRLRHCDVARDRAGEVVAITFARDIGYIESVRQIEAPKPAMAQLARGESTLQRKLRTKRAMITIALGIISLVMVLDEVLEHIFH